MKPMKKIAIAGAGYVGLSNAVLLAQHHEVVVLDIDAQKVEMLDRRLSPIADAEIEDYLQHKPLHLAATTDAIVAIPASSHIASPTEPSSRKRLAYESSGRLDSKAWDRSS